MSKVVWLWKYDLKSTCSLFRHGGMCLQMPRKRLSVFNCRTLSNLEEPRTACRSMYFGVSRSIVTRGALIWSDCLLLLYRLPPGRQRLLSPARRFAVKVCTWGASSSVLLLFAVSWRAFHVEIASDITVPDFPQYGETNFDKYVKWTHARNVMCNKAVSKSTNPFKIS